MKFAVAMLVLCFSDVALSCYCTNVPVEKMVEESDYIYLSKVTSSRLINEDTVENTLIILETIKGEPDSLRLNNKLFPEDMCAGHAVVGYKYVIFGQKGEVPEISSCSYSQSLQEYKNEGLERIKDTANKQRQPTQQPARLL